MTDIVSQLFGLTEKLIGLLLSWPFLLFAFLFWVVNRYRDQIGSMLDRRGAVKASVLSKAVKQELEPVSKELETIVPTVSALRYELDQLKAAHAEDKLTPALEPIRKLIAALDGRISEVRAESGGLVREELSAALAREREVVCQDLTKFGEALAAQQCRLATLAPREAVDALAAGLEPTRAELAAMSDAIALLHTEMDAGASKNDIERLQQELATLKGAVETLQDRLKSAQTELEARLADRVETLSRDMGVVKETVDRLDRPSEAPVKAAAAKRPVPGEASRLVPLNMMKQVLASPRWIWRRVETLARTAEISEDEALSILSASPDVTVGTNNKGERIAKLATR